LTLDSYTKITQKLYKLPAIEDDEADGHCGFCCRRNYKETPLFEIIFTVSCRFKTLQGKKLQCNLFLYSYLLKAIH